MAKEAWEFPLVEVHWIDSYSDAGWFTVGKGEAPSPPTVEWAQTPIVTVGFLLHEDERVLTVSHTVHRHSDGVRVYYGSFSIPKAAVLDRWEVVVR